MNEQILNRVTNGYLEAIAFTDFHYDSGIPDDAQLAQSEIIKARDDCRKMLELSGELAFDYVSQYMPCEYFGHDFWLTRNYHGAGFWDRGLGDLGNKLTEISKSFGQLSSYVGDDDQVYLG